MAATDVEIPGYIAGTWAADPHHSEVSFTFKHLMVTAVRGRFKEFKAEITLAEDPLQSSVNATIDVASVSTNFEMLDYFIRGADTLSVDEYPEITFRSTGVRPAGDHFVVDGDLTIHGVTKPVSFDLMVNGFQTNCPPMGDTRAGFSASLTANRHDFGLNYDTKLDNGDPAVSDTVELTLEIQALLQQPAA